MLEFGFRLSVAKKSRSNRLRELRRGSFRQGEDWSAKILFRLLPGRREMRKSVRPPGAAEGEPVQMRKDSTTTTSSVEVTPFTRSAKILFRLLPGRREIKKGVRLRGAAR